MPFINIIFSPLHLLPSLPPSLHWLIHQLSSLNRLFLKGLFFLFSSIFTSITIYNIKKPKLKGSRFWFSLVPFSSSWKEGEFIQKVENIFSFFINLSQFIDYYFPSLHKWRKRWKTANFERKWKKLAKVKKIEAQITMKRKILIGV